MNNASETSRCFGNYLFIDLSSKMVEITILINFLASNFCHASLCRVLHSPRYVKSILPRRELEFLGCPVDSEESWHPLVSICDMCMPEKIVGME